MLARLPPSSGTTPATSVLQGCAVPGAGPGRENAPETLWRDALADLLLRMQEPDAAAGAAANSARASAQKAQRRCADLEESCADLRKTCEERGREVEQLTRERAALETVVKQCEGRAEGSLVGATSAPRPASSAADCEAAVSRCRALEQRLQAEASASSEIADALAKGEAAAARARVVIAENEAAAEASSRRAALQMEEADAEARAVVRLARTRAEAAEIAAERRVAAAALRGRAADDAAKAGCAASALSRLPSGFGKRVREAASALAAGGCQCFAGIDGIAGNAAASTKSGLVDAAVAVAALRDVLQCQDELERDAQCAPVMQSRGDAHESALGCPGCSVGDCSTRMSHSSVQSEPVMAMWAGVLAAALDAILRAWATAAFAVSTAGGVADTSSQAAIDSAESNDDRSTSRTPLGLSAVSAKEAPLSSLATIPLAAVPPLPCAAPSVPPSRRVTPESRADTATHAASQRLSSPPKKILEECSTPEDEAATDAETSASSSASQVAESGETGHMGPYLTESHPSAWRTQTSTPCSSQRSSRYSSLDDLFMAVPPETELSLSIGEVQRAKALDRARIQEERRTRRLQLCLLSRKAPRRAASVGASPGCPPPALGAGPPYALHALMQQQGAAAPRRCASLSSNRGPRSPVRASHRCVARRP